MEIRSSGFAIFLYFQTLHFIAKKDLIWILSINVNLKNLEIDISDISGSIRKANKLMHMNMYMNI